MVAAHGAWHFVQHNMGSAVQKVWTMGWYTRITFLEPDRGTKVGLPMVGRSTGMGSFLAMNGWDKV